jgi:hypothetical protein
MSYSAGRAATRIAFSLAYVLAIFSPAIAARRASAAATAAACSSAYLVSSSAVHSAAAQPAARGAASARLRCLRGVPRLIGGLLRGHHRLRDHGLVRLLRHAPRCYGSPRTTLPRLSAAGPARAEAPCGGARGREEPRL